MSITEAWFGGDGLALAGAIVQGRFSAVEAMERTLADVRRENARLNAIALLDAELGLARAAALDAELAASEGEAARRALLAARPFFGVPLLLKDIGAATAHVALPSRMGSRLFDGAHGTGHRWRCNGNLTERYLAAGFVPFGRTTVPELGISASTEARAYGGPTHNPYSTEHSAGGSSGGAAALLASGAVTLAHANDGVGSIRIPASCCGLIGLKPSRGLMPMGPLAGESWGGMATDHVLARSLRDCATALDVSAGSDLGAPYAAPHGLGPPAQPYRLALQQLPPRLRIAVCNRFYEGDVVHAEVAAAVEHVAGRLARWGHEVEPAAPPFSTLEVLQPLLEVVIGGLGHALDMAARQRGRPVTEADVEPTIFGAWRASRGQSVTRYLDALAAVHALGRRMAAFHERWDLLLTPVLAEPPARLGRFAMDNPDFIDYRLGPSGLWRYSPFTPLANATGAPSLALPVARSAEALPIGVMLSGRLGEDALLLQVAAQLQRCT
jgi:amidase